MICAYLRMPFIPPNESQARDEEQATRREELQVRLAAQRILAAHLDDQGYAGRDVAPETFWPEVDLIDLTGAHLVDFGLHHCRITALQLNSATLTGESTFRGMTCSIALIQGATFAGHTDFRGATFTSDAWFSGSTFEDEVWFHTDQHYPAASFGGRAVFRDVTFARGADFSKATFADSADFSKIEDTNHAVRLDGVHVGNPNAELIWPPGWTLEPDPDGFRLTRSDGLRH